MGNRQHQVRHVPEEIEDPLLTPEQKARYRQAADLLRQWRQAEDGYDQEVWPLIEDELKDERLRTVV